MSLHRARPRSLQSALNAAQDRWAPATELAALQRAWPRVAGSQIAAVTVLVGVDGGVLRVRADSAAWAAELQLLSPQIITALARELPAVEVRALRCMSGGN